MNTLHLPGLRRETIAVACVLLALATGGGAAGQTQHVRWYVLNDDGNPKPLSDGPEHLSLSAGWVCRVGETSKQLPSYEARTTICEKGAEAFQCVVQCERLRPKDHTQIGFLTSNRSRAGFIEVGCELL